MQVFKKSKAYKDWERWLREEYWRVGGNHDFMSAVSQKMYLLQRRLLKSSFRWKMYVYYTFGCYSIAFSEAADAAWSRWRRPPPRRFPQRPAATSQQRQQQPDEYGQQQPADGLNKFPSRAKKIDVLSRVIFPAIFAFFNISYWTFYLTQEANTEVN